MKRHLALVLTAQPDGGGKFQYSLSILNAFCSFEEKNYRISIIYFDDHWPKYASSDNCHFYFCKNNLVGRATRKLFLSLPFGLELWRQINKYIHSLHTLLNKLKPDLVIYPGNDPYVYESKLSGIIPIFDLMHKYEPTFPEISTHGIKKKRDAHYRNICRYSRVILVDSEVGKKHVIESYKAKEDKIFILPYVPPFYIYQGKGDINILKEFHLPKKYIFYPAKLWKHKNHIGLIEAISILRKKGVFVNAVFTGSKENAAGEIFSKIKELSLMNQISYLGYVNNEILISLYKNAVALVMPTFFGPTNIPQLEAFVLGCPVITSNIYGVSEQVGDAALLFDSHDVNDIARKILVIWTDEKVRKQLKEKGYRRSSEWNQEKFNIKLLSIVKECLILNNKYKTHEVSETNFSSQ